MGSPLKTVRRLLLTVALIAGFVVACQSVPETNRSQLILIDSRSEMKLGSDTYRQILSKSRISTDQRLIRVVRRVGARIAAVTGRTDYQWEFNLLETEVPNAFCLPGGKVAVNTGILPIAVNEAGLAAVMGHEVAHAIARHGAERMSQSLIIAIGGEALAQGLGKNEQEQQGIRMAYGLGSAVAFTLPFSRSHEMEADHLGLLYMARAGYDPREAKRFWERFAVYSKKKGNKPLEFLSTHPADSRRIAQIESLIPQAMGEYERSAKLGVGEPLL